jgi:hypothetical protein
MRCQWRRVRDRHTGTFRQCQRRAEPHSDYCWQHRAPGGRADARRARPLEALRHEVRELRQVLDTALEDYRITEPYGRRVDTDDPNPP